MKLSRLGLSLICVCLLASCSSLGGDIEQIDVAVPSDTPTSPATSPPQPTRLPTETPIPIEPTATPHAGDKRVSTVDGMTLIYIPGGTVRLGCQEGTPYCHNLEEYDLALDSYWIDETEVTNAMYVEFLNSNEFEPRLVKALINFESEYSLIQHDGVRWRALERYADHPAVEVLWFGADSYCSWVGRRLPFSAEWEYAARGSEGLIFPWGNDKPDSYKVNFCDTNCTAGVQIADYSRNDRYERTAPVGTYPEGASPFGVLDLAGNAWEWVWDWGISPVIGWSPRRIAKGGAYHSPLSNLTNFLEAPFDPIDPSAASGFRCAVEAADYQDRLGFPQASNKPELQDSALLQTEDIEYVLNDHGLPIPDWSTARKSFSSDFRQLLPSTTYDGAIGGRWYGVSDHGYVSLRVFVYRGVGDLPMNSRSMFPLGQCELDSQSIDPEVGEAYQCGRSYSISRGDFQHARGLMLLGRYWIEIDYEVQDPTISMDQSWLDMVFALLLSQYTLTD